MKNICETFLLKNHRAQTLIWRTSEGWAGYAYTFRSTGDAVEVGRIYPDRDYSETYDGALESVLLKISEASGLSLDVTKSRTVLAAP